MTLSRPDWTITSSKPPPHGMLRFTVESALLLVMVLVVFRAFFAEGYMISTGSMAPSLLGYHQRVCCPACRFEFARGASPQELPRQSAIAATDIAADPWKEVSTRCPNCGTAVPTAELPVIEGDQLMVRKHEFAWRDPQRWEVTVFRNPNLPVQAYVKRVVGLPGERISIVDGDVYANGVLQRKPLEVQRALRIPVSDHDHQPAPSDPDWRPRWLPVAAPNCWTGDGTRFQSNCDPQNRAAPQAIDWIEYRHWIRAGGHHRSTVSIDDWPVELPEPVEQRDGFSLDTSAGTLTAIGALPAETIAMWMARSSSEPFRDALGRLYLRSHQPPISDVCAYNHPESNPNDHPIHDLMLELNLTPRTATGQFVMSMHDGCHELRCTLDFEQHEVR
ncbi:MAG: signal peptidase I [Planctomycetaceae bacterium]